MYFLTALESGKRKIKVLADLVPSEEPSPGLQRLLAVSLYGLSLVLAIGKTEKFNSIWGVTKSQSIIVLDCPAPSWVRRLVFHPN